ncbi:hypothetical protein H106_07790 [Trichophyton rubrum CBS 735.88]|nr:hypothetical protein H106_07790 [Trichophyton rubrum CBS 735.88]
MEQAMEMGALVVKAFLQQRTKVMTRRHRYREGENSTSYPACQNTSRRAVQKCKRHARRNKRSYSCYPLVPGPSAARRLLGRIRRDEPKGCAMSKQEADNEGEWKKNDCEVNESRSQWYNPPRKKAKGAETTGTNESEQREKMKPKNSCCQFYPIRLCGKRRTEERPKRGKAFFGAKGEQRRKRDEGAAGDRNAGKTRKDDRYCWARSKRPEERESWSGCFEISGQVVGGVQRTNVTMHGAGGKGAGCCIGMTGPDESVRERNGPDERPVLLMSTGGVYYSLVVRLITQPGNKE